MVINLFKPRTTATTPGEELVLTSQIPLTIPAMMADARARFAHKVVYQQKSEGQWQRLTAEVTWHRAQDFAAGLAGSGIAGPGDSQVLLKGNHLQSKVCARLSGNIGAIVGRAVIDDDDLEVLIGGAANSLDHRSDGTGAIVKRDNH